MNASSVRLSIKVKLLLLFVSLTLLVLVSYASLILAEFRSDKLAYVFDTVALNARSVSQLIQAELENGVTKTKNLMDYFEYSNRQLNAKGQQVFMNDPSWDRFRVFVFDSEKQKFSTLHDFKKATAGSESEAAQVNFRNFLSKAMSSTLYLQPVEDNPSAWNLGLVIKDATKPDQIYLVVSQFNRGDFLDYFFKSRLQSNYLINEAKQILLSPKQASHGIPAASIQNLIEKLPKSKEQRHGVMEADSQSENPLLVAFSELATGQFRVLSVVPKSEAFAAARLVVKKSALFLILMVCIAVFVSVLGANGATNRLRALHAGIMEFSKSNFEVQIPATSRDEIGEVSRGFNNMAREIQRLMKEMREKLRMEKELETAKLVQSMLFAPDKAHFKNVEICGHFEPASECGGDWWTYFQVDSRIFLIITDATGHGVPAALLTSAARSASALLSRQPGLTISQGLHLFNQAIWDTARGSMQMTAFFCCLDQRTGLLTYGNASHEPPYVMRHKAKPLRRSALEPLMAAQSPRLGEGPNSEYVENTVQLESGDTIFFFTDGLSELQNSNKEILGNRKVEMSLVENFNSTEKLPDLLAGLLKTAKDFRGEAPLVDDLTFVSMRYL